MSASTLLSKASMFRNHIACCQQGFLRTTVPQRTSKWSLEQRLHWQPHVHPGSVWETIPTTNDVSRCSHHCHAFTFGGHGVPTVRASGSRSPSRTNSARNACFSCCSSRCCHPPLQFDSSVQPVQPLQSSCQDHPGLCDGSGWLTHCVSPPTKPGGGGGGGVGGRRGDGSAEGPGMPPQPEAGAVGTGGGAEDEELGWWASQPAVGAEGLMDKVINLSFVKEHYSPMQYP